MTLSNKRKNDKYRDLLCYAAQHLLDNKLLDSEEEKGAIITELCGKQSVIKWQCQEFEEVVVTVWWGYKEDSISADSPIVPLALRRSKVMDASTSGVLERKTGLWIMGSTLDHLIRSLCFCATSAVEDLNRIPSYFGYIGKTGKFII